MICKMYSIYDRKTQVYHPPFIGQNDLSVKRDLAVRWSKKDNFIRMFPDDYQIWELGQFDDCSGEFKPDKARLVCNAQVIVDELINKFGD